MTARQEAIEALAAAVCHPDVTAACDPCLGWAAERVDDVIKHVPADVLARYAIERGALEQVGEWRLVDGKNIVLATQPVYDGERHDALYRLAAGVPSGTPDPGAAT